MARAAPRRLSAPRSVLRGVLLDVDGTLLDSNDAHARSWVDTLRDAGYAVRYGDIRPLIGMGGDKLLPRVTGLDAESERAKAITADRAERFRREYLPSVHPTPGAHELVKRLRRDGLRLVIATSANEEELEALLSQGGLDSLLPERTSSSDADHSKPDPDIIQAALHRADLEASEAVLLGDTPYDIEAAARAGMPTVALRCGGWWDDEALSGAAELHDDPAALLASYAQSLIGARGIGATRNVASR